MQGHIGARIAVLGAMGVTAFVVAATVLPVHAAGTTTTTSTTLAGIPTTRTAGTYTSTDPNTAADFATGFPSTLESGFSAPFSTGPIGLAFDPLGNLWIGDLASGGLYKFGPSGGVASAATMMAQLPPGIAAIAFDRLGRMFISDIDNNSIYELDPLTGQIVRTVTTVVKCPLAMAFDPVSGDLFVSQGACGDEQVERVKDAESVTPTVTDYTTGLVDVDGLGFIPDGTLYAVNNQGPNASIVKFAGTQSADPGTNLGSIASVTGADGMTFSLPVGSSPPQYMYVNRNDGIVTRLDLTTSPVAQLDVMSGGTRGDFATTAADGCLYPTQSTSVVKIGFTNGTCNGLPTLVPQVPVVAPTTTTTSTTSTTVPSIESNTGNGGSAATPPAPAPAAAPPAAPQLPLTGFDIVWALLGAILLLALIVIARFRRVARHS